MAAIETTGVTKTFDDVVAVRDVDLTVREGDVYGLIGPNGSGKSTIFRILLDFVRPTSGRATIFDHDVHADRLAVRDHVGVVPEGYAVYDRLTGLEHVEFVSEIRGVDADPVALLERVGLEDAADRRAGGYSSGMTKRLMLAMALVGDPDLLLLDEPFQGLDPRAVLTLRETIRDERDRGRTVFFSSHLFREVEAVCDRVALLLDGEVIAEDDLESIRTRADTGSLDLVVGDPETATEQLASVDAVLDVERDGSTVTVTCERGAKTTAYEAISQADVDVVDFATSADPLEQVFLEAMEDDE
ncbi:MAG: ABC transporter ATP-binding protein [Haloarculaceae archaeon]